MKNKSRVVVTALLISTVVIIAHIAQMTGDNLLQNPGFELGQNEQALRCQYGGACELVSKDNVRSPDNWLVWYVESEPCSAPYWTGQPEAETITAIPDPVRVRSGLKAFKLFTFYRCHRAGLLQQVIVEGGYYQASIYAHAWYSQCSHEPHLPPLESDCTTPATWAHDWLRVGIDPTGGMDPRGESIVWGEWQERYGGYSDSVISPLVKVPGGMVTMFTESRTTNPLKHDDTYWDNAQLLRQWVLYLPGVYR